MLKPAHTAPPVVQGRRGGHTPPRGPSRQSSALPARLRRPQGCLPPSTDREAGERRGAAYEACANLTGLMVGPGLCQGQRSHVHVGLGKPWGLGVRMLQSLQDLEYIALLPWGVQLCS